MLREDDIVLDSTIYRDAYIQEENLKQNNIHKSYLNNKEDGR